jgi:hypothetical protein
VLLNSSSSVDKYVAFLAGIKPIAIEPGLLVVCSRH